MRELQGLRGFCIFSATPELFSAPLVTSFSFTIVLKGFDAGKIPDFFPANCALENIELNITEVRQCWPPIDTCWKQ